MTPPTRATNNMRERTVLSLTTRKRAPTRNDEVKMVRARKRQGNWSHSSDETACQMKSDFSWVINTESQKKTKTRMMAREAVLFLRQTMLATTSEANAIPH